MARRKLYSETLLGLENPNCTMPKCRSMMHSTGWLEEDAGWDPVRWFMEFECPDHGPQWVSGGVWQALIDRALQDNVRQP